MKLRFHDYEVVSPKCVLFNTIDLLYLSLDQNYIFNRNFTNYFHNAKMKHDFLICTEVSVAFYWIQFLFWKKTLTAKGSEVLTCTIDLESSGFETDFAFMLQVIVN